MELLTRLRFSSIFSLPVVCELISSIQSIHNYSQEYSRISYDERLHLERWWTNEKKININYASGVRSQHLSFARGSFNLGVLFSAILRFSPEINIVSHSTCMCLPGLSTRASIYQCVMPCHCIAQFVFLMRDKILIVKCEIFIIAVSSTELEQFIKDDFVISMRHIR